MKLFSEASPLNLICTLALVYILIKLHCLEIQIHPLGFGKVTMCVLGI